MIEAEAAEALAVLEEQLRLQPVHEEINDPGGKVTGGGAMVPFAATASATASAAPAAAGFLPLASATSPSAPASARAVFTVRTMLRFCRRLGETQGRSYI